MDAQRSEVEIEAAWYALFAALREAYPVKRKRAKYRGREIGGTSGVDGRTSKPGRLAGSYKFTIERFLDTKALRDAKRTRVGVNRT